MTRINRVRAGGGGVRIEFAAYEARIFAGLIRNLIELLYDGRPPGTTPPDPLEAALGFGELDEPGTVSTPDDPVLARLLPDAYADDPQAAAEFRRLTERSLRLAKAGDAMSLLQRVEDSLQAGEDPVRVVINNADVTRWLKVVNDLRLALGTRLEVTEDYDPDVLGLDEDDPTRLTYNLYDWLGYLQASMLHHRR